MRKGTKRKSITRKSITRKSIRIKRKSIRIKRKNKSVRTKRNGTKHLKSKKNIKGGWYVNKYANMFETHLQNFHKNLIELYKDEKKCETTSQYDTPQYDTPQCANISADMDTIRNAESKFVRDQRLGHPELIKKYYDKIEEEQRRKLNRTIGDLNKKNLVNTNINPGINSFTQKLIENNKLILKLKGIAMKCLNAEFYEDQRNDCIHIQELIDNATDERQKLIGDIPNDNNMLVYNQIIEEQNNELMGAINKLINDAYA